MSSHIKETYLRSIRMEEKQFDLLGNAAVGRAVTATLRVSPNGDGSDGLTWRTAYQTIQDALDAASTDGDDLTLILIGPHTIFYDINMTGDPTWAANVELVGPNRLWSVIRNTHAGATSILNFTGHAAIRELVFLQTGTLNGVSFTQSGFCIRKCGFSSSGLTGAATSIHIDGSGGTVIGGCIEDVEINGHVTHSLGLLLDAATTNEFQRIYIHTCLTGVQITDAVSDNNRFHEMDIGDCALGFDIDAGNEQHFENITFHHNTRNVDDEVGDHTWVSIKGQFPIYILPDNFVGVTVNAGAANVYGGDTQLIALNAIDNPFRIVGTHFEPSANEWFKVRFTNTAGAPYYDEIQFDGTKREGIAAPSGTEFIFNGIGADSRISCSTKSETGGNNTKVWVEVQEI